MSHHRLLIVCVAAASALALRAPPPFNCSTQPAGAFTPIELRSPGGGLRLSFLPYGGTVQRLIVAGGGPETDVVLGFDDPTQYCANAIHPYFGALIGRVANRIAGGSFQLDGAPVRTPLNEVYSDGVSGDTLHGGWVGWDRRVWAVTVAPGGAAATLSLQSPDGEEGFPGELSATVTYTLGADDSWTIAYAATAGAADTVVAMTQHTYWNLNGARANVTEHELLLRGGDAFLAVDEHLIPTGAITPVAAAPWMDFTRAKAVGRDIANGTATPAGGYDNAWVFADWRAGAPPALRAEVFSPLSGIAMQVVTDQPSMQFYSGNFLDGTLPNKADQGPGVYTRYDAMALEAQHYPDSVHQPTWPSIELKAGQTYRQLTSYRFERRR